MQWTVPAGKLLVFESWRGAGPSTDRPYVIRRRSMSNTDGYCIAAVGDDGEPKTSLASFDDVPESLIPTFGTKSLG